MQLVKQIVKDALLKSYVPVDDREIYDFAKDSINLPQGKFRDSAFFDCDKSPFLKPIFQALKDYSIHTVVFLAPNKVGKSLVNQIFLLWTVANRPGNFQWYVATADQSKKEIKNKIIPLLLNSPSFKHYVPTDDRKLSEDSIPFATMQFSMNGCSDNTLQQVDCCYVVADEVWSWKTNYLKWAESRLIAFRETNNSKFLVTSQGGLAKDKENAETELQQIYKRGDCAVYSVPCEQCKTYIQPEWDLMKFDTSLKDKKKNYLWNQIFQTIRFECPHCKHPHFESKELKDKWGHSAKYIPTNTNSIEGVRSFRITAIPTTTYQWSDLVREFLSAKYNFNLTGNPQDITTFFQQRMALNVDLDELYDQRDQMKFYDYVINSENKEAVARFSLIDVQGGEENEHPYYWQLIVEFSKTGDSWLLWFGKQVTEQSVLEKHKQYDIPNHRVFVDVGFQMTQTSGWIAQHGFIGLRGEGNRESKAFIWKDPKTGAPFKKLHSHVIRYPTGILENGKQLLCKYFFVDTNGIKDLLDQIRRGKTSIKMHRPKDNSTYVEQMDSEYCWKFFRQGKQFSIWKKKGSRDNHVWDLESNALAVCIMYEHLIQLLNNLFPSSTTNDDALSADNTIYSTETTTTQ